jgi:hypothetical protein
MRYERPQQTQIVGRVPIGVGLLTASLTGEVLAPARPKRAAARATLARRVRLPDLDANAGDVGLAGDACPKLKEAPARVVRADRLRNDRAPTHAGLLFATDPGTHLKRIFDDTFADGVVLRRLETSLLTRQPFHDRATTSSRRACAFRGFLLERAPNAMMAIADGLATIAGPGPFEVCRILVRPPSPPIQSTGDTRWSHIRSCRARLNRKWSKNLTTTGSRLDCDDHLIGVWATGSLSGKIGAGSAHDP